MLTLVGRINGRGAQALCYNSDQERLDSRVSVREELWE